MITLKVFNEAVRNTSLYFVKLLFWGLFINTSKHIYSLSRGTVTSPSPSPPDSSTRKAFLLLLFRGVAPPLPVLRLAEGEGFLGQGTSLASGVSPPPRSVAPRPSEFAAVQRPRTRWANLYVVPEPLCCPARQRRPSQCRR